MKRMRLLSFLLAALFILPASALTGSWYFKKTDDHTPPPIPEEFAYINDLGGLYRKPDTDGEKVLYLTFDAGYENGNIAKILDILKAHGVHGTFFILEHLLRAEPGLVRRMADEGHTLANHTMTHKNITRMSDEELAAELAGLEALCLEITGREMARLFRPPEGAFCREKLELLHSLGYKTVFWSFAYADWDNQKQPDPAASLKKLLDHTHSGEILLLHPTSDTNAAILDDFLTALEADGWRIGDPSELF